MLTGTLIWAEFVFRGFEACARGNVLIDFCKLKIKRKMYITFDEVNKLFAHFGDKKKLISNVLFDDLFFEVNEGICKYKKIHF